MKHISQTSFLKELNRPLLIKEAKKLQNFGMLAVSVNNLLYLDVMDEYIHKLNPLLDIENVTKPAYFAPGSVGAHISVVYPEEQDMLLNEELGQEHKFIIKNIVAASIESKTYYAILVESKTLLDLRKKYLLPDLLNFKGYSVSFHITIGVSS